MIFCKLNGKSRKGVVSRGKKIYDEIRASVAGKENVLIFACEYDSIDILINRLTNWR